MIALSFSLGFLFVLFGKWNKAFRKDDFQWGTFFRMNIAATMMSLCSSLILVLNMDEVVELMKIFIVRFPLVKGGLFAGVLGAGGQVVFQLILDFMNPNKKTKFGINKRED